MKDGNWLVRCASVVIVSAMLFVGGCGRSHAGAPYQDVYGDRLVLSGDNKDAAYVWTDMTNFIISPVFFLAHQQEYVGWSTDGGRKNHIVSVARWSNNWEYVDDSFGLVQDLQYSQDSTRLAALASGRIEVIDVESEKRLQLKPPSVGTIQKMQWVSPDKIAYVAYMGDEDVYKTNRGPLRKVLFIQDVAADSKHEELFSGPEASGVYWKPPYFFFSPDGKYVAIVNYEDTTLLNLADGQTKPLNAGPHTKPPLGVWSPDCSALLLVTHSRQNEPIERAVLIDISTGKATDLTGDLGKIEDTRKLHVGFAANNQLVFGERRQVKVFDFNHETAPSAAGWTLKDHGSGYAPLVPGWVVAESNMRKESTAVRYADGKLVLLSKHHCRLSDDGKYIAEVIRKGKVTVNSFELPSEVATAP